MNNLNGDSIYFTGNNLFGESSFGLDTNEQEVLDKLTYDQDTGKIEIAGDLDITGDTTIINSTDLHITDNIIVASNGNTTNLSNSGLVVEYNNSVNQIYSGLLHEKKTDANYHLVKKDNSIIDSSDDLNILPAANLRVGILTANSITGPGASTGTNVNTLGTGVYKQTVGSTLEFKGVYNADTKIDIAEDANNNIILTVNESAINHNQLNNYSIDEHRIINDNQATSDELWSSLKISNEINNANGNLVTHSNATTGVHGVIGDVVGTTDLQDLSNKSFINNIDMKNNTLINVADPINNQDVSTKNYTDIVQTNLTNHTADATIHFTEVSINHNNISNRGVNTHAQIDAHISDNTKHRIINDLNLVGSATELYSSQKINADLTNHTTDATLHFTEASINHANILNVGTNTHAQIDTHIADDTKHRIINDGATAVTELWSANKINSEIQNLYTYTDNIAAGVSYKECAETITSVPLPAYTKTGSGVGAYLEGSINGALPVISGVQLAIGDRLIVDSGGSQSDIDNGIYQLSVLGDGLTPWRLTRTTDFDGSPSSEIKSGLAIFVCMGDFKNRGFIVSEWDYTTNVVDIDPLIITQFSALAEVTAGLGMTKTGDVVNVIGSSLIQSNADNLQIKSGTGTAGKPLISAAIEGVEPLYEALTISDPTNTLGALPIERGGTNSAVPITNNYVMGSVAGAIQETNLITNQVLTTDNVKTMSNKRLGSDLDAKGFTVIGLREPVADDEAATKLYTDTRTNAITDQLVSKLPCRVSSIVDLSANPSIATVNYTSNGGVSGNGEFVGTLVSANTMIFDGVTIANNDRILIKSQVNQDENGIYFKSGNGTSFTLNRATDFDEDSDIQQGNTILTIEGANQGAFILTTANPINIGGNGDDIIFEYYSSLAGDGLQRNETDGKISVDNTVVRLDSVQTLTNKTNDELRLGVGKLNIANNTIAFSGVTSENKLSIPLSQSDALRIEDAFGNSYFTINTDNNNVDFPFGLQTDVIRNAGQILVLPTTADTLVGRDTTDILTNKSFNSNIDMKTNRIVNVLDPTANQDVATKFYVDSNSGGTGGDIEINLQSLSFINSSTIGPTDLDKLGQVLNNGDYNYQAYEDTSGNLRLLTYNTDFTTQIDNLIFDTGYTRNAGNGPLFGELYGTILMIQNDMRNHPNSVGTLRYNPYFIDVSTPFNPVFVGKTFNANSGSKSTMYGRYIYRMSTSSTNIQVYLYNSDGNPTFLASVPMTGAGNTTAVTNDNLKSIQVQGSTLYRSRRTGAGPFSNWVDIFSLADPSNPQFISQFDLDTLDPNLSQSGLNVFYGSQLYTTRWINSSSSYLGRVDFNNPYSPTLKWISFSQDGLSYQVDAIVIGNYVLVYTPGGSFFKVFDGTNGSVIISPTNTNSGTIRRASVNGCFFNFFADNGTQAVISKYCMDGRVTAPVLFGANIDCTNMAANRVTSQTGLISNLAAASVVSDVINTDELSANTIATSIVNLPNNSVASNSKRIYKEQTNTVIAVDTGIPVTTDCLYHFYGWSNSSALNNGYFHGVWGNAGGLTIFKYDGGHADLTAIQDATTTGNIRFNFLYGSTNNHIINFGISGF